MTTNPKTPNKGIRYLIMVVALGFLAWSLYQEKKPEEIIATMEYRMVTGQRDGHFQIIMMETADRFFVLDSVFRETFEGNDAEIVSRQEFVRLLGNYKDVQFRAGFSAEPEYHIKQLRTSREHFNQLSFESRVSALVSRKVPDSLMGFSGL